MKPPGSRASTPSQNSVRGLAPMNTNTAAAGDLPGAPPRRCATTTPSRRSVPLTSSTSVSGTTSMLGVAAI